MFLFLKGEAMSLLSYYSVFKRITDINIKFLKDNNINTLLLDVDNTLSTHHGTKLVDGLDTWLSLMRQEGVKLIIISNSVKFRTEQFANKIDLPFISIAMKPLPFGYKKAIKLLGAEKNNTAIIGDQLFTDVLGANFYGIKPLLVRPIKLEKGLTFKIRRYFERKILKDKF